MSYTDTMSRLSLGTNIFLTVLASLISFVVIEGSYIFFLAEALYNAPTGTEKRLYLIAFMVLLVAFSSFANFFMKIIFFKTKFKIILLLAMLGIPLILISYDLSTTIGEFLFRQLFWNLVTVLMFFFFLVKSSPYEGPNKDKLFSDKHKDF